MITAELGVWLAMAFAAGAAVAAALAVRVRARHERARRRQMTALQTRFDDLFERSNDVMVVHDRAGRIAIINRACEHLCGYSREEVRMIDANWLFNQSHIDTIHQMIAEGPDAAPRSFRTDLLTRKGAEVPLDARAAVVVGDGEVVGVTLIASSLLERDQLQAQLRQAQKMEAVGRLATGIAHDFNNLITVLLGYSEELDEQVGADSPLRRPVAEVRRAAERASGLTQQLLAFTRRQVTVPQALDLSVTIGRMRELLRRLLGAEITLQMRLPPDLGLVNADPIQIGQIVMNLAVNARDAMPNGGALAIETARVDLGAEHLDVIPGPHVMVLVRDTGMGMSADVQRSLFEPFFTTKEAGHGTGLGLSMVWAIVKQGGGHVAVSSEVGKGSTFRVYFPLAPAGAASSERKPDVSQGAKAAGRGVVLLAEDDPAVRRLLSKELRRRGFTVLEAQHGGEALDICRQHPGAIDALVTDVVMPTMNGVDLVAAAAPVRPAMRVLFMSGHPERAGVGLVPAGPHATNMLMKPFTTESLVMRINEMLGRPNGT